MTEHRDVFISYASEDKAVAIELADALKAAGLSVWIDTELMPGDELRQKISDGLAKSRFGVVMAWRFDLEFVDNLVMPPSWGEPPWAGIDPRIMARSIDTHFVVKCDPDSPRTHPVMEGVRDLAFVSAASVRPTTLAKPELTVFSEPNSLFFRPLGIIDPDGSRPDIVGYVADGVGAAPLLVVKRKGRGRVIAAGTWKLCTADYYDNFKLIENAFRWLGASDRG